MAAVHRTSGIVAGNLLRLAKRGIATRWPGARPYSGPAAGNAFEHYADLCRGVLREAGSLAAAGRYGQSLRGLLVRACDLLDEIDEFLVAMNPLRDGEAYLCAAELHRALEEIQAGLPRQFRGRRNAPASG